MRCTEGGGWILRCALNDTKSECDAERVETRAGFPCFALNNTRMRVGGGILNRARKESRAARALTRAFGAASPAERARRIIGGAERHILR